MTGCALAYRLGCTPWERYGTAAAASIAAPLDREEQERPRPPGRALDLGCGGRYTRRLAERGWDAVGVDYVPQAVAAAVRNGVPGARFRVGDVTDLRALGLGSFDFFLDVGCWQGLAPAERRGPRAWAGR